MIEKNSDAYVETITEYEEAFGPLPSTVNVSSLIIGKLEQMCRGALRAGKALTKEQLGVSPVPDGADS